MDPRPSAERLEASLRALIDTAQDGIVSADAEGRILQVNRAAERMFGSAAAELQGQPLTVLMPERYREAHLQGMRRFLQTREGRLIGKTVELAGRRKDGGEFPLELSLSSWNEGEAVFFTAIIRDITERKRIQKELQGRLRDLEVLNQELESFSYSVSHDLRVPLRAMEGFSKLLLEDLAGKLDPESAHYLERISDSARRMEELIDALLLLSRVTRSEFTPGPVDLSAIAAEIAEELRRSAPERKARFEIAPGLTACGDARLLRVAFENLLGNAWKFTRPRPEGVIEVGKTKGAYFVRDNGAGFDMAYADKLFGAFQRLHDSSQFPGTGIGLATVKRIIHRHGGRVWAEGRVDQGATFYFTLGE